MRYSGNVCLVSILALNLAACGGGSVDSGGRDPADLIKLAGDGQVALPGTAVPESLVVEVLDAAGHGVASVPVLWTVAAGGGSVAPASSSTDATGRLAARWTLGGAGPNTVVVGASGFTVTFNATATSAAPARLALVVQLPNSNSGVQFSPQPVVQIQDGQGVAQNQPGVTVTAAIASGSSFASLNGTTSAVTGTNGQAVFTNLAITGPVGDYTLEFTASGLASTTSNVLTLSTVSGRIPLIDMGSGTYKGFPGGLYPNGQNGMPAAHATAGASRARNLVPRGLDGTPTAGGKIVLLSVGMSNTSQEWCADGAFPCDSWSFIGQASTDGAVNHTTLSIVNGARAGLAAPDWMSGAGPAYDHVRDSALTPQGLSEAQVQVVWIKLANVIPTVSLPSNQSDAAMLLAELGDVVRVLHTRYPNLQLVFLSSRIYGGYAQITLNPEPYAYESGYAVKWLIQAQIDQMANGGTIVDDRPGNLNYNTVAPWIAWGPYLWADGLNPRSDGLTWVTSDMESDGTHPSTSGETKVGARLLNFFKTDARASCWFLANHTCP
jgi:hypothetical protein